MQGEGAGPVFCRRRFSVRRLLPVQRHLGRVFNVEQACGDDAALSRWIESF
jgi:hypothetical protein